MARVLLVANTGTGQTGKITRKNLESGSWDTVYSVAGHVSNPLAAQDNPDVVIALSNVAGVVTLITSTDAGATWNVGGTLFYGPNTGSLKSHVVAMDEDGGALYTFDATSTSITGLYTSTDGGANWVQIASPLATTTEHRAIWVRNGKIWVLTRRSSPNGVVLARYASDGTFERTDAANINDEGMAGNWVDDSFLLYRGAASATLDYTGVTNASGTPTLTRYTNVLPDSFDGLVSTNLLAGGGALIAVYFAGSAEMALYRAGALGGSFSQVLSPVPFADVFVGSDYFAAQSYAVSNAIYLPLDLPNVQISSDNGLTWASDPDTEVTEGLSTFWTGATLAGVASARRRRSVAIFVG